MISTFVQALEDTSLAVLIRQSAWLYPIIEIIHIIGIALLVGPAIMFDLRLLGLSKNIIIQDLAKHLLPWSQRSLFLLIPSGLLLFITNAATLWVDPVFRIKLVLLVIAGVNALLFHKYILTKISCRNVSTFTGSGKLTAVMSIILWLAIIACGRLLAY